MTNHTQCLLQMVHFYEAERSLTADPDSGRGRCHALGRSNEKMQLIAFDYHVALLTRQPTAIPLVCEFNSSNNEIEKIMSSEWSRNSLLF